MHRKIPQIKKFFIPLVLIVLSLLNQPLMGEKTKLSGKVKNVIIMIPDGCSTSIQTLARLKKGAPLALDELNCGAVKTFAANSLITDSAASATAFATGYKTTVGFISVAPWSENLLPIVSTHRINSHLNPWPPYWKEPG
jgi:alkaline phosphatase